MKTLLNCNSFGAAWTGALALAAFTILAGGSTLEAGTEPGYSYDGDAKVLHQDWMSKIPSSFKLSYLSLPGTHDSMARIGGYYVQTQSMDLQTQLDAGIRVLDIRIDFSGNSFNLSHGIVPQLGNFELVLETVVRFLMYHPAEAVLMRVKCEQNCGSGAQAAFEATFQSYWNGFMSPFFWKGTSTNPTLGEIRGHIVVLQNFSSAGTYGIPYTSFYTQDDYGLSNNWDLYHKWTEVKYQLILAHDIGTVKGFFEDANMVFPPTATTVLTPDLAMVTYPVPIEDVRYMNYLSGASRDGGIPDVFPYFVASGKITPATDGARLATGKTSPGWKDWPDFPRVDCFLGICTIAFEGTNNLTYDWLGAASPTRVGIIMADFPGPGLIQRIIDVNTRLAQKGSF